MRFAMLVSLALLVWHPGGNGATGSMSVPEGPCDIFDAAPEHTPCVAAHSTVRALYAQYAGPLYKVSRPNNASANISVLKSGLPRFFAIPKSAR